VKRIRHFGGLVCLVLAAFTLTTLAQRQRPTPEATVAPTPAGTPGATASPAANPVASPSPTPDPSGSGMYSGLRFRNIGPAVTSGRVNGFAVDPTDSKKYYVAVASGGVWKTVNGGTTWSPVFENESSYSIGAIAIDPRNPSTVWVGTGEYNSQRSVGYGDGVYRSDDGGRSWRNVS